MTFSTLTKHAAKWLGCGAVAVTVAACASNTPNSKEPVDLTGPQASAPDSQREQARNDADTTIQISDDFRRECQLPNAPQEAPHFSYADATLHAKGQNILDDVAKCLKDGPLAGRVITIIGRTDPRGSAEYNKQLSASRAEAARNYIVQRGVATANVRIIARGEKGARGTDEATWAMDRRVDFELGDRTSGNNAAANNLNASPSPILEGTRMDAQPQNPSHGAASYSDTAEGGHEAKTVNTGIK